MRPNRVSCRKIISCILVSSRIAINVTTSTILRLSSANRSSNGISLFRVDHAEHVLDAVVKTHHIVADDLPAVALGRHAVEHALEGGDQVEHRYRARDKAVVGRGKRGVRARRCPV